jgi:nitric-oxide synthase
VRLQVSSAAAPGYVSPERYAPKALHRQTDQLLCGRCSGLTHGVLANAVAGQGRNRGAAAARPGLVTPEQLRAHLAALRDRAALVVLLVDATDFSGSFLPRLRDAIGRNPVLLLVTKADLLPAGTDSALLARWIEDEVAFRRLSLAGLHLVSAASGDGMEAAARDMAAQRRGRDVVVVGAANVGKSSFIRAALGALRAGGDASAADRRLPLASPLPGTTLGVIPLRAFGGDGALLDTPGVVLHHRVVGMLEQEELLALSPGRRRLGRLRAAAGAGSPPAEAGASERDSAAGLSFFLEGLLRVDVIICRGRSISGSEPPTRRMQLIVVLSLVERLCRRCGRGGLFCGTLKLDVADRNRELLLQDPARLALLHRLHVLRAHVDALNDRLALLHVKHEQLRNHTLAIQRCEGAGRSA